MGNLIDKEILLDAIGDDASELWTIQGIKDVVEKQPSVCTAHPQGEWIKDTLQVTKDSLSGYTVFRWVMPI